MWVANLGVVERSEAEAIYDSGRDRCVEFILELARGFERLSAANTRLEERVRRLEEQARTDSRTSSAPPSADPPKTRQQRRAEARAKGLLVKGAARKAGVQPGHDGTGRKLLGEDQMKEIFDHYPEGVWRLRPRVRRGGEGCPAGVRGAVRWRSCHRSRSSISSIARTGCAARAAERGPVAPWASSATLRSGRSFRRR